MIVRPLLAATDSEAGDAAVHTVPRHTLWAQAPPTTTGTHGLPGTGVGGPTACTTGAGPPVGASITEWWTERAGPGRCYDTGRQEGRRTR